MVKETRITFEPGDILALTIVCDTCKAETRLRMGSKDKMGDHCPHCETQWKQMGSGARWAKVEELRYLLASLTQLVEPERYRVRIEVRDEP